MRCTSSLYASLDITFLMKPQNATCFQKNKNLMFICTKFFNIKIYKNKFMATHCGALLFFERPETLYFLCNIAYFFLNNKIMKCMLAINGVLYCPKVTRVL